MFQNQTILITGGTGSWGKELTLQLLKYHPKEIRIYARNELSQVNLLWNFGQSAPIKFVIGDVRDYHSLEEACRGVDYVFHMAALKHVPICEIQQEEALKTNVYGTYNLILASARQGVKKVVNVSTDKAVDPVNFYGMTKALGEKMVIRANDTNSTRFVNIRGGNVLGTNGSVVPLFKKQIENGEIRITSKKMTRFFLSIADAIGLLIKAATISIGGETFVMRMKTCRILDMAMVIREHMGRPDISICEIGIRPGEKLHEILISAYEAERTYQYDDRYYVLLPYEPNTNQVKAYGSLQKANLPSYYSDSSLMTQGEIKAMLDAGGLL
ncbi:polysaccharide biosynthesis protein [Marininema halotolerans]|uniref:Polysaccharide biosynthesis protein n=1 Tax=Marininema halotolerans TaxID=1155944 RepID=A0A1I6NV93_9BACL|nr:polysaccharide biosynthesis protein [Marininema halotolerans]SFS31851.1 Polysaccharide biosynthesis protein [Marininema halotolerans]